MTTHRVERAHVNAMIDLLERGHLVVGALPIPNGSIGEAARLADSDFDCAILETEHHGFDLPMLRTTLQAMVSRGSALRDGLRPSVTPLVRVPRGVVNSQWIISQTLDLGPYGLVVPHLESASEAQAIVSACRYPRRRGSPVPDGGRRGYGPDVAARYWGISPDEYAERADTWPLDPSGDLLLVGMIESMRAVENISEILDATSGFGVIFPGPGDLCVDLGVPGEPGHDEVVSAIDHVRDACIRRGIACAAVASDAEEFDRRVAEGFRVILTRARLTSPVLEHARGSDHVVPPAQTQTISNHRPHLPPPV